MGMGGVMNNANQSPRLHNSSEMLLPRHLVKGDSQYLACH